MSYVLGVVGGSGIYDIPGLEAVVRHEIATPFGAPSDSVLEGRLGGPDTGVRLLFLPRHSRNHGVSPTHINYRANVCALKQLGATHLVSLSAVGSMREDIAPGDVVVVDQYIDLTKQRASTFFDQGLVAHVSLADPVCPALAEAAASAVEAAGGKVHRGGTYVCMEGPQFSSRAESKLYRSWGVSVIGMTAMPEAKLAREAELPYATIAFATDYDCWHETEEAVSVEAVLSVLKQNAELAKSSVQQLATRLPDPRQSPAFEALKYAIITNQSQVRAEDRARLSWLLPSGT